MTESEDRRRNDEVSRRSLMEALIAGLAKATSELSEVGRDVAKIAGNMAEAATKVAKSAELTRFQRWVIIVLLTCGTAGSVFAGVDGLLILHGQGETHKLQRQVADCTTPKGKCYRQGQEQTGRAIAILEQWIVISSECARIPSDDKTFETCVQMKAKAQGLVK